MKNFILAIDKHQPAPSDQLRTDLLLPSTADDSTLVAELVRAVVHASTRDKEAARETTLTDRCVELLIEAIPGDLPSVRALVAEHITALTALGDLTHFLNGTWVPGSTKIVSRSAPLRPLLISGLPLRLFPDAVRNQLVADGPVRLVVGSIPGLAHSTVDEWAGPTSMLNSWTAEALDSDGLHPAEPDLFDTDSIMFRFYCPERRGPRSPRSHRWLKVDRMITGRQLMRITRFPIGSTYAVAEVDSGRLVAYRHIHPNTANRLAYGLDDRHGRSIEASRCRSVNDTTIIAPEPLPYAESRLLTAVSAAVHIRQWTVPPLFTDRADLILAQLISQSTLS